LAIVTLSSRLVHGFDLGKKNTISPTKYFSKRKYAILEIQSSLSFTFLIKEEQQKTEGKKKAIDNFSHALSSNFVQC
jgi:hypothetical protein